MVILEPTEGLELRPSDYKSDALPLCYVGASRPSNQPFFNKLVKRQAKIESNGNFVEGLKAT